MPTHSAINRFTYSRNGGGNVDETCLLRVNIPGIVQDKQCTRYKIDVTNVQTRQTWQVVHRYSEFLKLRDELLSCFDKAPRKCPGCVNYEKVIQLFEFPTKRYFTSKNTVVVNYRRSALRSFVALLASHSFSPSPKCPTCSGFPFTAVRDFLTEELQVPTGSHSSSGSSVDRDTIRESMNVKDFTKYVPVPELKPVNSEGVFIKEGSSHELPGHSSHSRSRKGSAGNSSAKALHSPTASSSGSTAGTASLPPSPVSQDELVAPEDSSFSSFTAPPAPVGAAVAKPSPSTPRRQRSKRRQNKSARRASSHLTIQTQHSVKESVDEDFGSLNMDFLKSISVAAE